MKPIVAFVVFYLVLSFPAWPSSALTNITHRDTTSLNGKWHTIVDPYETGYFNYRGEAYDKTNPTSPSAFYNAVVAKDKSELIEYRFDQSPTLNVPGDWNAQREALLYYEGTVWYHRQFDYVAKRTSNRVFVHFGAVNYKAEVYLNGHKLGVHEGGFTPFQFEIGAVIKPKANVLVVKVDNRRHADAVPTQSTDWWNYGGITRDVTLIEEPSVFIRDFTLQLKPGTATTLIGAVHVEGAKKDEPVDIAIPELNVSQRVLVDADGQAALELNAPGLVRWSPAQPKRYRVIVTTAHQMLRDDIGFRSIETRGVEILLNGEPIFLRGISIHEENPLKGTRAVSKADAKRLLQWAKELGCNYVRLAHYPHNEHMVRLADEMGLMVWSEIPVYWTIAFTNAATLANARAQLTDMVKRDRNRAAVIIWSVANETPPSDDRNTFLRNLVSLTRALDRTRLVSAALETRHENGVSIVDDKIGEQLDIVAFNQYRGWYGGTLHDAPEAKWEVRFNKPVIISEFGGDAKQGLHGDKTHRWTEEYQEYLYRQTLAMLNNIPQFRGVSPWILADFRSPRRVLPGIQDGYNRKGLISSKGVKKKAFYVLRDFYKAKAKQMPDR